MRLGPESQGFCNEARGVTGEKGFACDILPPALRALKNRFVTLIFFPFFLPRRVILEQNVSSAATVLADK